MLFGSLVCAALVAAFAYREMTRFPEVRPHEQYGWTLMLLKYIPA